MAPDTGSSAEDSARRLAAGIAGAIEGFLDAIDRYDLPGEAQQGMAEAGSVVRAAAEEGRTQAQTPEMRELGGDLKRAGTATTDAVRSAKDATVDRIRDTTQSARASYEGVKENARERAESAKYAARRVQEDVRVRAGAVAESSRRATRAPGRIASELRGAAGAWWGGFVRSLGMMAAMAILGGIALVVLTIALVVSLNNLLGDPIGTFLVFAIYAVVAAILYFAARSARARARREVERRVENSREEVRHVTAPVRDAFGRGRSSI